MIRLASLFNGFLWLVIAVPLFAAQVDDIRIVIDVSGSMQQTDPNNLRAPALRLINGLIPTGSKAGVWTFGRYVNMEVKWGTVNSKWRKLADEGANKIHSRGQFTNIESALKRASKGWGKKDIKTSRNLILLTDGKVDISKDKAKNALSRSNVLSKSIPELIKKGIKVHTIALSDKTDEALLKRLALKTSGSFEVAKSAEDLQRIFLHMFERATKPDTVPLKDNTFTIDESISEMTLLVFRKGKKETALIQPPDKKKNSQSKHAENVRWRFERGYDLITVSKPQPGKWSLDAEVDEDNRVMIVTKLKLIVADLPAYVTPDKALNLNVELHSDDIKINKKSFLKFVDFNLQHSVGEQTKNLPLKLKKSRKVKDKGIYLQQVQAPLVEGKHEVVVKADARTFTRSKRFIIEVQWPIKVDVKKALQPATYNLSITGRDEYIKSETLQLDVLLIKPDGSQDKLVVKNPGNQPALKVLANQQDGVHKIQIKMKAETVEGKTIEHTLDDYSVLGVKQELKSKKEIESKDKSPEVKSTDNKSDSEVSKPAEIIDEQTSENETDSDWLNTLIYVGVANLIVILIVVGSIIFIRKRKKVDEIELFEDELDEEEDEVND
ncbi:MAG: VWA domain-containing protein [Gammaproteobacteria bacterium]|nr:VWA domain-containing protein [Gammaproteobacteria bacterium]MBT3721868.1 VWA domain-containing protein [Gammaproteobacteria bacterium]MBT4075535.1 VWA domain-containing protein [Gammaproteobacteria bacterium]MBT4451357.1 VWA domain-containing protein [Gammaproteobacteria bacterium]MBT4863169.1 VWA domain-containing protein [Gammaproteobacteria bacterium]